MSLIRSVLEIWLPRIWAVFLLLIACTPRVWAAEQEKLPSFEEYLRKSAVPREVIEAFLSGSGWVKFDAELGYVRSNYIPRIGIDQSATLSTTQGDGARTSFMYVGRKARINTYGDSFTEGMQVNDGETWQEALAAHLGEPIRNFGVGGYGVYQAYRRMLREEASDHAAEYIIFSIWGDAHVRSLFRARHAAIYSGYPSTLDGGHMFHGNFWPHVELEPKSRRFVEKENQLFSEESLYHMSEPQWMVDHLKGDLALQLSVYSSGLIRSVNRKAVDSLAARLDFPMDWSLDELSLRAQASALLDRYSLGATLFILEKVKKFAREKGKKVLVVLCDPQRVMSEYEPTDAFSSSHRVNLSARRYDQPIVDYLAREKMSYFDMNEIHIRDFKKFSGTWEEYLNQYFIGHYNPRGNNFFAASIKDAIVQWLEPKPITYQNADAAQ